MTEIVSCARDTQLHNFPGLEQLSSSAHVHTDGSDCQFLVGSSKLFVRSNKNWGVELLRIKSNDQPVGGRTLATVKKIMIENLYCVACPRTSGKDEIAIGLTCGMVRFMSYKKANFSKRFDADRIANAVTFMDFNATDDFLAVVYENGQVNLYGMKTSTKLQKLAFDNNTVKARFHPTKRCHLAVASYKGAVVLYDSQSKKPVYSQPAAHQSSCRDLAMVESFPDYLFSVGYDSVINIFDVRRNERALHIQSNYPFESLAIADGGQQFAVGNLKGYVYGYDLRSLKEPLNMRKVHQTNVNSLVFVPFPKEGSSRRSMTELEMSKKPIKGSLRVSEGVAIEDTEPRAGRISMDQHDSFMGEIDMFLQRRDIPMDCMSRLSTSSRLSMESRSSMQMAGNNLMGLLEDLSDCHLELNASGQATDATETSHETAAPTINDSFVNVNRLLKRAKVDCSRLDGSVEQRLHRPAGGVRSGDNLEYIREEGSEVAESDSEAAATNSSCSNSSSSHRDSHANRVLAESQHENTAPAAGEMRKSGPQSDVVHDGDKENQTRVSVASVKQELSGTSELAATNPHETVSNERARSLETHLSQHREIAGQIEELRSSIMEQFQNSHLQQLDAEQALRSFLWMGMFNLWRETQSKLESLEKTVNTGLGLLLAKDEFAQQFIAMRSENETLKNRLHEMEAKLHAKATMKR
ncbi:uncharacterized protein LOC131210496 [Anopheles bellator]|uniref:uncharacterized protein LOC131210496 n=1 Tax=Anopheles bellator TaxID=139047 RepID=UPI002648F01B|nr:uncharacterized protein LOC131210496 [Anopheles bellator]